ncbi:MAG: hypothetical protein IT324_08115 [Anaerolineae bacterium]|nr:hypothetical protein [Anaerolineae bacterium]
MTTLEAKPRASTGRIILRIIIGVIVGVVGLGLGLVGLASIYQAVALLDLIRASDTAPQMTLIFVEGIYYAVLGFGVLLIGAALFSLLYQPGKVIELRLANPLRA